VWPEPVERVAVALRAGAVDATIQEFPEGTPTAEAAARAIGCSLAEIVKSIVFICDGKVVLALLPGDRRADEAKVAAAVGAPHARVAHAREVVAATGFQPGAVAPLALRAVGAVVLEQTALVHERVWVGAGSDTHMAGISPSELQRLTDARTADIVVQR